jgi:hypothetical protein
LDSTAYQDFVISSPVMLDRAGGRAGPQTMSAVIGEGLKPLTVR